MTAPACHHRGSTVGLWRLRLDCPRPTDPPGPLWTCHRCLKTGPFRRRDVMIWQEECEREETE